jgi:hypothetical protein
MAEGREAATETAHTFARFTAFSGSQMKKSKLIPVATLIVSMLSVIPTPARAGESYFYQGTTGFSASFFLLGGEYSLYVNAKRPLKGPYAPESKSCLFGGNFERVSPSHDAMSLGSGITISTIVPHKIGPESLKLAPGLYHLYIPTLTTCDWKFVINSTSQNTAGVAPVQMFKITKGSAEPSPIASVKDRVEFSAQYRTDHDAQLTVTGTVQIINAGKVVQTLPLQLDKIRASGATLLYVDVQWEQSDAKYLGKNSVKFVVQMGPATFTSTGEFTLVE